MGAKPTGPGPHFHRGITESFSVLSGTVRLHDGRRCIDGTAGDFLHVPIRRFTATPRAVGLPRTG